MSCRQLPKAGIEEQIISVFWRKVAQNPKEKTRTHISTVK